MVTALFSIFVPVSIFLLLKKKKITLKIVGYW